MIAHHVEPAAREERHAKPFVARLALPVLLALIFLGFHLPYLPASLEDLDSINFALGVRQFDVGQHQPHPPGYPLFIAAAKGTNALIRSEATALAAVSVVAGALGVLAIAALFRRLESRDAWVSAATALAIASPMYWFTAARPLSDVTGLAAASAVQALILAATSTRALIIAAFCAGLAAGLRSQVVWLTLPLLVVRAPHRVESSKAGLAYAVGVLLWAVPLVIVSGGPAAYSRALFNQGAEDLSGITMLWTTPTVRTLVDALYYACIAPWAQWPIAIVVLLFAAAGASALLLRDRRALLMLAVLFGPYFVFDLVFQETFTSRYALPLVIPAAFLAAAGAQLLPKPAGLLIVSLLAVYCAYIGGTSVSAYASQKAPAFRLLDDMRTAARETPGAPVVAMDRREEFDLRRPIRWAGDAMLPVAERLPSPPQHEWLEVVKYWTSGGRAPVWFIADPLRTDIDLIQHPQPVEYRWSVPYPVLLGGVRPNEMDWHRITRPEWYLGEGWGLTPEAAGTADLDRRGLAFGAIDGWIAGETLGGTLIVGGRNFESEPRPVTMTLDAAPLEEWTVAPGFFLRFVTLPRPGASTVRDYAKLTVRTQPPSRVAIEQFDASASRAIFGYGDGWHEPEYNPQTGRRWRWLSERGELKLRSPRASATVNLHVNLHIEGESPRAYFSRASRLVVRVGTEVVIDRTFDADFALDAPVPLRSSEETITLETDQIFIPAERGWLRRSGDRRHLGLRILKCEIRAVS